MAIWPFSPQSPVIMCFSLGLFSLFFLSSFFNFHNWLCSHPTFPNVPNSAKNPIGAPNQTRLEHPKQTPKFPSYTLQSLQLAGTFSLFHFVFISFFFSLLFFGLWPAIPAKMTFFFCYELNIYLFLVMPSNYEISYARTSSKCNLCNQ